MKTRLIPALLLILSLCALLCPAALAAEDWQQLDLYLQWTDGAGIAQTVLASPMPYESVGQSFWVQVPADAPLSEMEIHLSHALHPDYSYQPADGSFCDLTAAAGGVAGASGPR